MKSKSMRSTRQTILRLIPHLLVWWPTSPETKKRREKYLCPFFKYSRPSLLSRRALLVGVTATPQSDWDAALGVEPECFTPVNLAEVNALFGAARQHIIQPAVVEPIVCDGVNRLRFQDK
jgi:hypothetical protein